MNWDPKKWGTVPAWVTATVGVLTLFLLIPEERYSRIEWSAVATVGTIVFVVIMIFSKKIYPMIEKRHPKIKEGYPRILAKGAGFIFSILTKTVVVGAFLLAMSFLYTDYLPAALGKVLKSEGVIIAKETEQCILEGGREDHEKVIITLVDSEAIWNVVYRDALYQAGDKGYIQFIDGRYQTASNWVGVPFTLPEDRNSSEKRLILTLTEDERRVIGGGEKIRLRLTEVITLLPEDQRRQILKEIDSLQRVLLTEEERKIIEECFNKDKGQELYSLMYLVLSDAKMTKVNKRKEVYDVEYYELQKLKKGDRIAEDERIVELSDSLLVIKEANRHLTPYDKIGIMGCYIDELRFQHTKPKNEIVKLVP